MLERFRQATQLATANDADGKIQVLPGDTVGRTGELGQRPGDMNAVEMAERQPAQNAIGKDGREPRREREDPRHQAHRRPRCGIVCGIRDKPLAERLLQIRAGHGLEQLDALCTPLAAQLIIASEIVCRDRAVRLEDFLLGVPLVVVEPPVVQLDLAAANQIDGCVQRADGATAVRHIPASGPPVPGRNENRIRPVTGQVKLGGGEQLTRVGVVDIRARIDCSALGQAVFEAHLEFVVPVVPC